MSKNDYKVSAFRQRHEKILRRLVTQGCCVASCTNDGMAEQEEVEMNEFAATALLLVEQAHRAQKRSAKVAVLEGSNVVHMSTSRAGA